MNDSSNNRNLIIAVLLSAALLFGWQYFIGTPALKKEQERQAVLAKEQKQPAAAAPGVPTAGGAPAHVTLAKALAQSGPRIRIDSPSLDGSLLLKGARFDDVRFK